MTYNIYGIPNCGSVKKALEYFEKKEIEYTFINFKKEPVTEDLISNWLAQAAADRIINTKGTTWRKLDESIRDSPLTPELAGKLAMENNSIIKRPVITREGRIVAIGFDSAQYDDLF